jgi:hypothetical protein
VELTPEREYLLVTEFFAGAAELGEAEIDEGVIDDGLRIIRKLWDAGLAHRDIKPANLLVRDGQLLLIDVAFVEARPSPWRQAVDLANMMLCLALRSDPRLVYQRALRQFSVQEISEGFAAARGLALPSQLRHMLRQQGRDLHAEFLGLLPERPHPMSIQRFSVRRIALALLVLLGLVAAVPVVDWTIRTDRFSTSLYTEDVDCTSREALWLMAQAVPSAALVPCVQLLPAGWTLKDVTVGDGNARITFNTDRPHQMEAVAVQLTASCELAGARRVTSEQPGASRYIRFDDAATPPTVTRFYVFAGGCVTERFMGTSVNPERLAADASVAIGFASRQALGEALSRGSDGRLQLDPTSS